MRHIYLLAILLATLLATSCADDDRQAADTIPDGYGRLAITISTPEAAQTRAVSTSLPWLEGTNEERAIMSYHLLVCSDNTIIDAISGSTVYLSSHEAAPKNYFLSADVITTNLIPKGTYNFTIYCLANFTADMVTATGLTVSAGKVTNTELPANFEKKVMQPIANGLGSVPSTGLPMTGKLTQDNVSIGGNTTTINDPLILWRMMAKLEFSFTNQSNGKVRVKGIEVEPINQATAANGSGVYLISQDDLFSLNNQDAQYISATVNKTGLTATWALHDATMQTEAVESEVGLLAQAQLSWGYKLQATGLITAEDADATKLQKFKALEKVITQDEGAAIILTVRPMNGLAFTPKKLSFKACRGGTDGGHFDVVAFSGATRTDLATNVRPARWNGDNGSHVSPFISSYEYNLSSTAIEGIFCVKIYLHDLDATKEYAFSDFVITGDVKNADGATGEGITLPYQSLKDVGSATYESTGGTSLLELDGAGGTNTTGMLFFYVNETDATYTAIENQLSLRFKIQRWNSTTSEWYDDEIRFGLTTPYTDGTTGGNGFNVIRRNDWIHIPVVLRDWQFRIEPLAFVPIAGYPATTLSSDGLTATFSTGGPIILQPFAQKNNDGTWRDFSDPEVTFVSLTWKNSDGTNVSGDGKIIEQAFAYDSDSKCIYGVLNNNLSSGTHKTTVTVNVKLGPSGSQYDYSFTFNVVLQK